jgi:DNA polymerase-3 subunit delta'
VIPYKRNLRVGAIRSLEVQANYRPYEARARIFIVDDADKMNDAASNALLKTLEEPPSSTYIILVTSRPNMLMPTNRSRCQTIRFAPVSEMAVETLLRTERDLAPEDAHLVARLTKGSVARALDFDIDQFRTQREIQLANIEKALVKMDRPSLVRASEQMNDAKNKDNYEANLEILESLVRDIWLMKSNAESDAVANFDVREKLKTIADQVSTAKLTETLKEIELLRQSFIVNINRKSATDALFMKMSA